MQRTSSPPLSGMVVGHYVPVHARLHPQPELRLDIIPGHIMLVDDNSLRATSPASFASTRSTLSWQLQPRPQKRKKKATERLAVFVDQLSAHPTVPIHRPGSELSSCYTPTFSERSSQISGSYLSRMDSIVSDRTEVRSMASSSDSGSKLRVVGRGGVGSRPRTITGVSLEIHTRTLDIIPEPSITSRKTMPVLKPKSQKPKEPEIRIIGRGGLGAKRRVKPTKDDANLARAKSMDADLRKSAQSEPPVKGYRIAGRGGSGSKPRPLKLVEDKKGKGKEKEKEREESGPNALGRAFTWGRKRPQKENAPPSDITPQVVPVKDDPAVTYEDLEIELSSSPIFPTFTDPNAAAAPPAPLGNYELEDLDETPPSSPVRKNAGSLSKLARTMGDLPPGFIYEKLMSEQLQKQHHPLPQPRPTVLKISTEPTAKPMGPRALAPAPRRGPSPLNRANTASSSASKSTISDDVHRFNMSDDLSDSWGRDSSSWKSEMSNPSPIVFHPPTPIASTSKVPHPLASSSSSSSSGSSFLLYSTAPTESDDDGRDQIIIESVSSLPGSWTPVEDATTPTHTRALQTPIHSFTESAGLGRNALEMHQHYFSKYNAQIQSLSSRTRDITAVTMMDDSSSRPETPRAVAGSSFRGRDRPKSFAYRDSLDDDSVGSSSSTNDPTTHVWSGEWNNKMEDVIHALRML